MSQLDINAGAIVANASESERATFIQRAYIHLAGAIIAFAFLEALLIKSGIAESFIGILSGSKWSWMIVLGLFMGVSYIADNWARTAISPEKQYMGLGLFVIAEAVVFMPLIYMALAIAPDMLTYAALLTAVLVGGITFTAFTTKKNFSFLGKYLAFGGIIAMGIIIGGIIFGYTLGLFFMGAMIVFAAFSVLYSTSNIIHEYHTAQHVSAALGLFSSVALLFWYILQFLMSMGDD